MNLFGLLLALIPLFGWGTTDFLSGRSSRKISPYQLNVAAQVPGLVLSTCTIAILGFSGIIFRDVAIMFVVALFLSLAFLSVLKGYRISATGLVAPIANSYAVVTLIIGVLFLGVSLTIFQFFVVLMIIVGSFLLGAEFSGKKIKKLEQGVFYAFLAALFWGVGFSIVDLLSEGIDWWEEVFLLNLFILPISFLFSLFDLGNKKDLKRAIKSKEVALLGTLGAFGAIGFFASAEILESVLIPAVVAAASPLFTSLLSWKLDNEKLRSLQRVGAVLVVFGIVVLQFA